MSEEHLPREHLPRGCALVLKLSSWHLEADREVVTRCPPRMADTSAACHRQGQRAGRTFSLYTPVWNRPICVLGNTRLFPPVWKTGGCPQACLENAQPSPVWSTADSTAWLTPHAPVQNKPSLQNTTTTPSQRARVRPITHAPSPSHEAPLSQPPSPCLPLPLPLDKG